MTPEEEARDARRLKRLEMIQAIVARVAQNSFAIKGWAITVCAGILALAAKDGNAPFAPLAIAPTLIFWGLDAHYLSLERRYRALYERAAADLDPAMTLTLGDAQQTGTALGMPRAMVARTVLPVYLVLLMMTAAAILRSRF